jgi:homogentisate phytyltransferase/homogentisate geranylgeranyltransferase
LPTIPPFLWALTLFIVVFSFAIAIFKDIPDIEGDRQFNINTFTVQLGQQAVFSLARWVLTACYVSMMGAGFFLTGVNRPFLITSHAVALGLCWLYSFRVDWQSPAPSPQSLSYPQFYQFIWKLFFMEYLIFPAACLLA